MPSGDPENRWGAVSSPRLQAGGAAGGGRRRARAAWSADFHAKWHPGMGRGDSWRESPPQAGGTMLASRLRRGAGPPPHAAAVRLGQNSVVTPAGKCSDSSQSGSENGTGIAMKPMPSPGPVIARELCATAHRAVSTMRSGKPFSAPANVPAPPSAEPIPPRGWRNFLGRVDPPATPVAREGSRTPTRAEADVAADGIRKATL